MTKRFKPVKGSAQRYIDTKTGEQISRREKEKRQHGGVSQKERKQIQNSTGIKSKGAKARTQYANLVTTYKRKTAEKLGVKPSQVKVRGQSAEAVEFRRLAKELKRINKQKNPDLTPKGELAQILIKLNLRSPEWDMPVGESPTPR